MSARLAGKKALITAAGAGIGRATALAFAGAGANVLATDIDADALTRLAAEHPSISTRLLDVTGVQAHLARGGLLLDARAPQRFRGEVEPIDRAAGHVPGAVNRPFAANLADGRMKPAALLADEYRALLCGRDVGDVVAMCGSGVTACHLLLAMEHAGLPGARLFTGSWSGWVEDPARPVATGAD